MPGQDGHARLRTERDIPLSQLDDLVGLISREIGRDLRPPTVGWGDHLGATLADTALQGGINYDSVVRPRIARLIGQHPEAATLSGFSELTDSRKDLARSLRWKETSRKLDTLGHLVQYLGEARLETVEDLRRWLGVADNPERLRREVPGVGPKSRDYLCILVGLPSLAVDSRLRSFVEPLGLTDAPYEDLKDLYIAAAHELGINPTDLDRLVWEHEGQGYESQRRGRC